MRGSNGGGAAFIVIMLVLALAANQGTEDYQEPSPAPRAHVTCAQRAVQTSFVNGHANGVRLQMLARALDRCEGGA